MSNLSNGQEKEDSHQEGTTRKEIQGQENQTKQQLEQALPNFQGDSKDFGKKLYQLERNTYGKIQDKHSKVIVIRVENEQELLEIMDALSEIERKKNRTIPKAVKGLFDMSNLIQLQSMAERRKKGNRVKNKKEKQNIMKIQRPEREEKISEVVQSSPNNCSQNKSQNLSKEESSKEKEDRNKQNSSGLYSSSNFTSVVEQESESKEKVEEKSQGFLNEAFLQEPNAQEIREADERQMDSQILRQQKICQQYGQQGIVQSPQKRLKGYNQQSEKCQNQKLYTFHEQKKTSYQNQEWYQYLKKLSYAQTELTYLGQQMNWTVKFFEGVSDTPTNLYECNVQIVVISSLVVKKITGFCNAEKSKKEAKHHASIKCLAQIYSTISGLFKKYRNIKEETPALKQPEKSDNTQILESWGKKKTLSQNDMIDLENYQNQLDYKPDVNSYVRTLKSCKKQLYYFIAQNNKIFMPPKWNIKKSNYIGFWQAEGWVRFQLNNLIYEYRFKNQARNKKEAEEKVSEYLLKQIYNDFPYLFKKFKQVKILKGLI